MHYEVNAPIKQLEATFADIFEFAHVFSWEELKEEIHDHLDENLFAVEAVMMERFRREFIVYQGSEVVRWFPSEIVRNHASRRPRSTNESDMVVPEIRLESGISRAMTALSSKVSFMPGGMRFRAMSSLRGATPIGMQGYDYELEYTDQIEFFVDPLVEIVHRGIALTGDDGGSAATTRLTCTWQRSEGRGGRSHP